MQVKDAVNNRYTNFISSLLKVNGPYDLFEQSRVNFFRFNWSFKSTESIIFYKILIVKLMEFLIKTKKVFILKSPGRMYVCLERNYVCLEETSCKCWVKLKKYSVYLHDIQDPRKTHYLKIYARSILYTYMTYKIPKKSVAVWRFMLEVVCIPTRHTRYKKLSLFIYARSLRRVLHAFPIRISRLKD